MFKQATQGIKKNAELSSVTGKTSADYLNALASVYFAAQDRTMLVNDNELKLIESIVLGLARAQREADILNQRQSIAI